MGWPEADASAPLTGRIALGLSYGGTAYHGWQSQPDGRAVQDQLESALRTFCGHPVRTHCAGRTDAGVHAANQVVHLDAPVARAAFSWVRGVNRYLPMDIAVRWCRPVAAGFHARNSARGRRYRYLLMQAVARPGLASDRVGWVFRPLSLDAMRDAADRLVGEHDFSSFRSAECQAASPVKNLRSLNVRRQGALWQFDFDASAFLHHMVRNLMGCLVAVGTGQRQPGWIDAVLQARDRAVAAPTFSAAGLYFLGPYYDAVHGIPEHGDEAPLLSG
ncbi:MAG: tRNA pseudouridine(38-40) synthase TruA [Aquabacterium sp.]